MELTNIRFTFATIHKLSRETEILKCVSLFILFLLVLLIIPSDW